MRSMVSNSIFCHVSAVTSVFVCPVPCPPWPPAGSLGPPCCCGHMPAVRSCWRVCASAVLAKSHSFFPPLVLSSFLPAVPPDPGGHRAQRRQQPQAGGAGASAAPTLLGAPLPAAAAAAAACCGLLLLLLLLPETNLAGSVGMGPSIIAPPCPACVRRGATRATTTAAMPAAAARRRGRRGRPAGGCLCSPTSGRE